MRKFWGRALVKVRQRVRFRFERRLWRRGRGLRLRRPRGAAGRGSGAADVPALSPDRRDRSCGEGRMPRLRSLRPPLPPGVGELANNLT